MTNDIIKKLTSLKGLYLCLVILACIELAWTMLTGEYQDLMSLAVDKAEPLPENIPHDLMVTMFIAISLAYAVAVLGVGYFLLLKTYIGRNWAKWLFIVFCVWHAITGVFESIKLNEMYPGKFDFIDYIGTGVSSVIFLVLAFKAYKHPKSRPISSESV